MEGYVLHNKEANVVIAYRGSEAKGTKVRVIALV